MVTKWQNLVQKLEGDKARQKEICDFYNTHNFDMELRKAAAVFFEDEENWITDASMNPVDKQIYDNIHAFLKEKVEARESYIVLYQLQQAVEKLKMFYPINEKLAELIKKCLDKEREMICQLNEGLIPNKHNIADIISECKSDLQKVTHVLQNYKETIAGLVRMQLNYTEYVQDITQIRTDVIQNMYDLLLIDQKPYTLYIYRKLLEALNKWQRCQQIRCISEEMDMPEIKPLQQVFERFAEFLLKYKHEYEELQKLCQDLQLKNQDGGNADGCEKLDVIQQYLSKFFDELISKSFIIEEQPTQIFKEKLKKCNKFNMVVRFLVGNSILKHCNENKPKVQLSFHCEHNLMDENMEKMHIHGYNVINETAELLCGIKRNECHCTANFSDSQVSSFKRCNEKKTSQEVTEQKYGIMVKTQFTDTIYGNTHQLEALSLPIVVTTQTSQDWSATGTILWDNAFSEPGRKPYQVASSVPWAKLSIILSERFRAETGRGLDANHLAFLASKILRTKSGVSISNTETRDVPWSRFNKDEVSRRCKFTFWKWFYAVTNVTKMHLQKPWRDGLIHGFISKEEVTKKLSEHGLVHGNFLLRFSETKIEDTQGANFGGALVVAYLVKDATSGTQDIGFVQPFLPHQFEKTPVCEFLENVQVEENVNEYTNCELQFLYPNKKMQDVFRECFEEELERRRQNHKGNNEDLEDSYKKFRIKYLIKKPNGMGPMSPSSQVYSPSASFDNQVSSPQSEASFQATVGSPHVAVEPVFNDIPIPVTVPEEMQCSSSDFNLRQLLQSNMTTGSGESFRNPNGMLPSSQVCSPPIMFDNQVSSPQSEASFQTAVGSPHVVVESVFNDMPIPATAPEEMQYSSSDFNLGQILQNNMTTGSSESFSLENFENLDLMSSQHQDGLADMENEQY